MILASQVVNITTDPHQKHEILYQNQRIEVELRYLAAVEIWIMDVRCKDREMNGIKLTAGADLLYGSGLPYTFALSTTEGIDPFTMSCFATGRSKLFFIDRADL